MKRGYHWFHSFRPIFLVGLVSEEAGVLKGLLAWPEGGQNWFTRTWIPTLHTHTITWTSVSLAWFLGFPATRALSAPETLDGATGTSSGQRLCRTKGERPKTSAAENSRVSCRARSLRLATFSTQSTGVSCPDGSHCPWVLGSPPTFFSCLKVLQTICRWCEPGGCLWVWSLGQQ